MIQNSIGLEEYAVPASVLFVFLLLVHQRHRFGPAAAPNVGNERGGRPSGRIHRAASVVAEEIDDLDGDESGSIDSEGAQEYPPSPSDSLSSNAEPSFVRAPATRAERSSPKELESPMPGAQRRVPGHSTENRRSLPSGSRSVSASVVQDTLATSGAPPTPSRVPKVLSAASQSVSTSRFLQPKVEPDDEDFVLDPISTPLPPKRASTPYTPVKARGTRSFTPDENPSSDGPPLSSPLPPKQLSASARTSSATRGRALHSGPSSSGSRTSRSGTATPSSASTVRASTRTFQDATPPPTSAASSCSATSSRMLSPTPDRLWTPMSRMSSLSPTPSEVAEQYVRKVSSRTVPSSEDAVGATDRVVVTAWFESSSDVLIDCPSDLRDHPDLQLGDLFYHFTPNDYQLWIWEEEDDGVLRWVPVKFMSERNGMYLTLTPGELRPSWVSQKYALTRKRDLLRRGYTV